MMKKMELLVVFLLLSIIGNAQSNQPKLIVGIVVDQMKWEYLVRFQNNYSEEGIKRLMNQGFECRNTHFNYIPTYTGPGHASIFTGTTPSMHGIISNDFYDRFMKKRVYCAFDPETKQTEGDSEKGKMSAARVLTTTIGDELKLANLKSKVIAVSEKDRASTFPAGHNADGAYWLEGSDFITSEAYMNKTPEWVKTFNKEKRVEKYLSQEWNLLLERDAYVTEKDDTPYEEKMTNEESPIFPHDIPQIFKKDKSLGLIKATPFGNSLTVDMAIAAINGEQLGADENMDLLCVSFSSTDYVGHGYGTHSLETEDTYYRLDRDIARLLSHLDKEVGEDQYTVFFTSDHGAAVPSQLLLDQNIPGGFSNKKPIKQALDSLLNVHFAKGDWIDDMTSNYIFLNEDLMEKNNVEKMKVYRWIKEYLVRYPGVHRAYDRISLMENDYNDWLGSRVQNGFNAKYSPDIIYLMEPGYIDVMYTEGGTTHGSGYNYDTHVPLLFMGYGIPKGEKIETTSITDIVPTLCTLFDIPLPSGCTGTPIIMKEK